MSTRLSREEVLKKKAEDEARRAGTLPAEKDAQGRVINPHIPEFMKVAPWYMGNETIGLDHQRLPESQKYSSDIHAGWYERGRKTVASTGVVSSSSSKATCTNCGASTHIAKNCLEKPRKQNAVKTGSKLGPDDVSQPNLSLSYDGKRDTYNGFDVDAQMRALQRRSQLVPKADDVALVTSSAQGTTAASKTDATNTQQKKSDPMLPKASLRVRSDLAKYLRNLDPESAFYDPKTRSMRANPNPDVPLDQLSFAGDNFVRNSGEAVELDKMEAFASQRSTETSDASQALQANPTALALAKKEFEERKAKLAAERKKKMEEQYGTSTTTAAKPAVQASSAYVEYAPDGKLLTDSIVVPVAMSKYEEDVFERNHTSVWGSYFEPFSMSWGYACCWQTVRSSYCTGEAGKQAIKDSLERARPDLASNKVKDDKVDAKTATTTTEPQAAAAPPSVLSSAMYGEGSVEAKFDQSKLAEALKRIQPSSSSKDNVKRSRSDSSSSSSDWSTTSSDESDGRRRSKPSSNKRRRSNSDESSTSSRGSSGRKKHRKSKKSKKSKKQKKHRREKRPDDDRHRKDGKKVEPSQDDFGRDSGEITPEDLEAHRLTRILAGDPMADMLNKNGDVDVAQL